MYDFWTINLVIISHMWNVVNKFIQTNEIDVLVDFLKNSLMEVQYMDPREELSIKSFKKIHLHTHFANVFKHLVCASKIQLNSWTDVSFMNFQFKLSFIKFEKFCLLTNLHVLNTVNTLFDNKLNLWQKLDRNLFIWPLYNFHIECMSCSALLFWI